MTSTLLKRRDGTVMAGTMGGGRPNQPAYETDTVGDSSLISNLSVIMPPELRVTDDRDGRTAAAVTPPVTEAQRTLLRDDLRQELLEGMRHEMRYW